MIFLTQQTIPKYFTIANPENSWFTEPTNTYNFVNRNSKELVVTVGDSWTYGSDITLTNADEQPRIRLAFGNVLAEQIGADWLNLAMSAQGNFYIAAMVGELANLIPHLNYKKITVICTFTGIGRWFNTFYDLDINYIQWFNQNIHSQNDFDKLLFMLNDVCVSRILDYLKPFNHVKLKIGTNFVEPLGLID